MAVEHVERLLRSATEALNAAGVEYAVIGGNAVAAWIATVDTGAVRATKDVDLLVRRSDLQRLTEVFAPVGMIPIEVLGVHMFVDEGKPNPKTGVHLVLAGERVRPEYAHPAPDPSRAVSAQAGYRVLALPELVTMKLQAFRLIDRVHLLDLREAGLLTDELLAAVPADLRKRLDALEQ